MGGNGTMVEAGEATQAPEGEFPGNGSKKSEAPASNPDDTDTMGDDETSDSTSENTGLLSGLINAIKSCSKPNLFTWWKSARLNSYR